MPDRTQGPDQGPMQGPKRREPPVPERPTQPDHTEVPVSRLGTRQLQSLGRLAGNKTASAIGSMQKPMGVQRVEIDLGRKTETIYERPDMSPGGVPIVNPVAGQKDFVATRYGMNPKYKMTRSASTVDVEVRIQFVDQKRGTNQFAKGPTGKFLLDKSGSKVPDPQYRQNVGKITQITDAARIQFAQKQCAAVSGIWSGNYQLEGKQVKLLGGALDNVPLVGDLVRPDKAPIKLNVNFKATPVFDTSTSNVHTTIRLFGNKVVAKRSGAHPIDAGHWYMNTKNYGGVNVTAISAHEYGHLLGLHDEYSRSNDQVHQQLHLMGGEARRSQKKLDAHTTRQMVATALFHPINSRILANIGTIGGTILGAQDTLQGQLASALRSTWRDASVRSSLVANIEPALSTEAAKRALHNVVTFQTGENFSNISFAKSSFGGFAAKRIKKSVTDEFAQWYSGVMNELFAVKGADNTVTKFSTDFSANLNQSMAAPPGSKADSVVKSVIGSAPMPKIPPSGGLTSTLSALPDYWKQPGKGLDTVYTPALAAAQIAASVKTASAAGLFGGVSTPGDLYRPVLDLVSGAAKTSATNAVNSFVDTQVRAKVQDQLSGLRVTIDNEIQAALGMTAGGLAAKSNDPNMQAIAASYLNKLQSKQNKKTWKQVAIINPGGGSGDRDARYTASSMMGNNNATKSGFRADMIEPVVKQFNANLKRLNESNFTAKKR